MSENDALTRKTDGRAKTGQVEGGPGRRRCVPGELVQPARLCAQVPASRRGLDFVRARLEHLRSAALHCASCVNRDRAFGGPLSRSTGPCCGWTPPLAPPVASVSLRCTARLCKACRPPRYAGARRSFSLAALPHRLAPTTPTLPPRSGGGGASPPKTDRHGWGRVFLPPDFCCRKNGAWTAPPCGSLAGRICFGSPRVRARGAQIFRLDAGKPPYGGARNGCLLPRVTLGDHVILRKRRSSY